MPEYPLTPADQSLLDLDWKESARAATTAALPANTRTNNTLNADANGALPSQDTVALAVGDRFLVKNEGTAANNCLYRVSSLGSAGTKWKLIRTDDADSSNEVTSGLSTVVTEGAVNGGLIFKLTTADPIVLNTTALTIVQTTAAPTLHGSTHDELGSDPSQGNKEIRGAAGTLRSLSYKTGALIRWVAGADGTAEGGSEVGSDYTIDAYDDTGSIIGNAIRILRASSIAIQFNAALHTFAGALQFSGTTHAGLRLLSLTFTQRNALAAPAVGDTIYNTTKSMVETFDGTEWLDASGATREIVRVAHGIAVEKILQVDDTTLAIATTLDLQRAAVIVSQVIDVDTFVVTLPGNELTIGAVTANKTLYLSPTSAGDFTETEPVAVGQWTKPVLESRTTTRVLFQPLRGLEL